MLQPFVWFTALEPLATVVKASQLHPLGSAEHWENSCHFGLPASGRGTVGSTGTLEPSLQTLSLERESFCLSPEVGRGSDPSSHKCITGVAWPLKARVAETQLTTQGYLGVAMFLSESNVRSIHPVYSPEPRHPSYKKKQSYWSLTESTERHCFQPPHAEAPSSSMYTSSFPSETRASQDLHIKS